MKKVILQKDLIEYLQSEITKAREKDTDEGGLPYKQGQMDALRRVLTHIWINF